MDPCQKSTRFRVQNSKMKFLKILVIGYSFSQPPRCRHLDPLPASSEMVDETSTYFVSITVAIAGGGGGWVVEGSGWRGGGW
jgi:hypothetical protein